MSDYGSIGPINGGTFKSRLSEAKKTKYILINMIAICYVQLLVFITTTKHISFDCALYASTITIDDIISHNVLLCDIGKESNVPS